MSHLHLIILDRLEVEVLHFHLNLCFLNYAALYDFYSLMPRSFFVLLIKGSVSSLNRNEVTDGVVKELTYALEFLFAPGNCSRKF